MFDFKSDAITKVDLWRDVIAAADAVTAGEPDPVANMANVAAVLFHGLPDLNWAGFYRVVDRELVLGPFQGKAACIRALTATWVWPKRQIGARETAIERAASISPTT